MLEKFEDLLAKKDKTLHDKMLIAAIRLIASTAKRRENDIYCQFEKEIELLEEMEGE